MIVGNEERRERFFSYHLSTVFPFFFAVTEFATQISFATARSTRLARWPHVKVEIVFITGFIVMAFRKGKGST